MARRKILCVIGTRPEAIKMAPVILELRGHSGDFETAVMATAQHRQMLDQVMEIFGIRPDVDLDIMTEGQTLTQVACRVMSAMSAYFGEHRPELVLAQGDTTTVMATALACFHDRIPFGHVEAGLRTGNMQAPFPEELNRRVASLACDYHFAPTRLAAENLRREGVDSRTIHVTGNPVIDALFQVLKATPPPESPVPEGRRYVLMTCHRREIFGEQIRAVFAAVRDFARAHPDLYFWYPVHPNPNVQTPAHEILSNLPNVVLTSPLDYVTFVHAMNGAYLILSDSGGIQEEGPALGKPVLVLRDATERREGVEAGTCELVGPHPDRIRASLTRLIDNETQYRAMARARNPYGDGQAARRIAGILCGEALDEWTL